jgi:nicotinamide riboside kinase
MPRRHSPINTIVVEFYGGPSSGKSEAMARLFSLLKQRHIAVEMAPEYAKKWAYEGRQIDGLDEFYILGKQIGAEAALLGKVAVVVTDRPVLMSSVYAGLYGGVRVGDGIGHAVLAYLDETVARGTRRIAVLVPRRHTYDHTGRFEDLDQAVVVDGVTRQHVGWLEDAGYLSGLYEGTDDKTTRQLADDIKAVTRRR